MTSHHMMPSWAHISRATLIENLETLRRQRCAYGPRAERCDCKYGVTGGGEKTGCPELREAIRELEAIENPSLLDATLEVQRLQGLINRAAKQLQDGLAR